MKLISLKNRIGADNRRCNSANGFSLLPLALQPRLFCWVGIISVAAVLLLVGVMIVPPIPTAQTYADEPAPATDPSITINTAGTIAANLAPTSSTGNFASASGSFSVTTTNELGYTLKIKSTTNNGTDLKYTDINNNNTVYTIPTLNADTTISESAFRNSTNTQYNNKWGYMPSKLDGEPNTNYRPAPSADGDTLDVTEEANAEANDYTISLGARVDYNTKVGNYSNTFVIEATANVEVIPSGLRVDFNGNGLLFSNNKATNTLVYDMVTTTETVESPGTQYIASCNVFWYGDDPMILGDYSGCSQGMSGDVFTVPGASYLVIYAAYDTVKDSGLSGGGLPDDSGDYVGIIRGSSMNMSNVVAMYTGQGGSMQDPVIATVPGDTALVGFVINSDSAAREGKMGYGAMIVGYDENDNEITGSTEVETIAMGQIYGSYLTPAVSAAYNFLGWSTDQNATYADYTSQAEINSAIDAGDLPNNGDDAVTLYAVYNSCQQNGKICYNANEADGHTSMNLQVASGDAITLWASNYSRSGYGFAGWNTAADGTGTNYGPNQTVATTDVSGTTLYAKWVPVAKDSNNNDLTFQTSNLLNIELSDGTTLASKSNGYVTALKDARDNQVYAVAKLADGKYWMIENLRLNAANSADGTKAQGFGTGFTGLPNAESSNFGTDTANNLYDTGNIYTMPRYNNNNINNTVINMISTDANIYSYGNYYTWAAAAATTKEYNSISTVGTSICPKNWRLPKGGGVGEFRYLNKKLNGGSNATDGVASNNLRAYPNNFVYSGLFDDSSASDRGSYGYYWSSTVGSDSSFFLQFGSDIVHPGEFGASAIAKYSGFSIRCIFAQ